MSPPRYRPDYASSLSCCGARIGARHRRPLVRRTQQLGTCYMADPMSIDLVGLGLRLVRRIDRRRDRRHTSSRGYYGVAVGVTGRHVRDRRWRSDRRSGVSDAICRATATGGCPRHCRGRWLIPRRSSDGTRRPCSSSAAMTSWCRVFSRRPGASDADLRSDSLHDRIFDSVVDAQGRSAPRAACSTST